jgi:hypothetical protein
MSSHVLPLSLPSPSHGRVSSSWWFGNVPATDAGRPPVPNTETFLQIVESWAPPPQGRVDRTIHVYTNAPFAQVAVNGAAQPVVAVPPFGYATWNVTYEPGTLTATALSASSPSGGAVLASTSIHSWGAPAAIQLSIDAPSPVTGTGKALFLDGADVALLRATIVDRSGFVCANSTANVTFAVVAGPGLVWGTNNGDPSDQVSGRLPPWGSKVTPVTFRVQLRGAVRARS